MKIEEDEQNYFPEDVPFPEYFQRLSIEKLKERFNEYLENNIEEQYLKNPEFYLSSDVNEKRFYLQIKEFPKKTDQYDDRDFREYFLIVKPLDTERVEMTDVKF
jgi:hypothetical protein